jgi:hypothetical protein
MTAKRIARILLLVPLLALAACSTGLRIFDDGFSATDLGDGRWAVKFDSTQVRSDGEAEANLMVHTARWAIDHGASYFTVHELTIGNETKIRTEGDAPSTSDAEVNERSAPSPTAGEASSSRVTATREGRFTARGSVRLWKTMPENAGAELYDASRVLDKYAGQRGRTATSRITVQEKVDVRNVP